MHEFQYEYAIQRSQELIREGERQRLAELARPTSPRPRFYAPLLATAGRRLAALGAQLERRYSAAALPRSTVWEMTQWN